MRRDAFAVLLALSLPVSAVRAQPTEDRFLWLEDVTGEKSLTWARARNAETTKALAETDAFRALDARLLAILDSDARIPLRPEARALVLQLLARREEPARPVAADDASTSTARTHPQWET